MRWPENCHDRASHIEAYSLPASSSILRDNTSGSAMAEGPRDTLSVEILQLQNIPFKN